MHAWDIAGLTLEEWPRHGLDIRIRLAAGPYMDGSWSYATTKPNVAYPLPEGMGVHLRQDGRQTNCSTLTTSVLGAVFPDAPWTKGEYGDLQVFADRLPDSPDSPVLAALRMGFGERVSVFMSGRWHLVQGVRRAPGHPRGFSGHAFLVLHIVDTSVLVLEATSIDNIGPRYRQTDVADLRRQYPVDLHIAVLPRV